MTRLALLAAIALVLTALPSAWADSIPPPPRYDHPYKGRLTVVVGSLYEVSTACGYALACAKRHRSNAGTCKIIRLKDDELREWGDTSAAIMRHELGHCNGWRH